MTLLDVCFEKQWKHNLVSRYGIFKRHRTQYKNTGSHIPKELPYFKMPNENFFESHPLIAATLAKSTQRAYINAFQDFQRFHRAHLTSTLELDETVHAFITESFQEHTSPGNRQKMSYLITFLALSPPFAKNGLTLSRRAISGWHKLKPALSALPLTRQIMLAFACFFQHRCSLDAAVALALQWSTYMRGSKVLRLKAGDVALPGDPRLRHAGNFAGVNIEQSKTGPMQFVIIRDKLIIAMLDAFIHRKNQSNAKLFNVSYRKFNSLFKDAALHYGLDQTRFTSHSARIGGALTDYCKGVSASNIALTGRWKSFTSLERYLTSGRSWLLRIKISSACKNSI